MDSIQLHVPQVATSFLERSGVSLANYEPIFRSFTSEISKYCELVRCFGDKSCGMVFSGENSGFSNRQLQLLGLLGESEENISFFRKLSRYFEDKRLFLKFEWRHDPDRNEPSFIHSCYFRRRPQVLQMLEYYSQAGIGRNVLHHLAGLAAILSKESIHFVAASFRHKQAPVHKWYFSQFVTAQSYAAVLKRILIIFDLFKINDSSSNRFINLYTRILPGQTEATLFISFSFDNNALHPHIKIDLRDVHYKDCLLMLDADDHKEEEGALLRFCSETATERVSYFGIRLFQKEHVNLKYYLDLCR